MIHTLPRMKKKLDLHHQSQQHLPMGLIEKVKASGDRLVAMSSELITNQTSNLAECYMGVRVLYDGGKHFNRVQSGSFQTRCYAAGLRIQSGPQWQGEVLEKTTDEAPNQVRFSIRLHSQCKVALFITYFTYLHRFSKHQSGKE